jgi:hypothetical protein
MSETTVSPGFGIAKDMSKENLADYCNLTNGQLAANASPVRLAVATVVTYQVVGVRQEEVEAFEALPDAEKDAYYKRYRTYTSAMFNGAGADLPYPSIYQ